jgi:hypothetical protein
MKKAFEKLLKSGFQQEKYPEYEVKHIEWDDEHYDHTYILNPKTRSGFMVVFRFPNIKTIDLLYITQDESKLFWTSGLEISLLSKIL